jgi:hypothetical protein
VSCHAEPTTEAHRKVTTTHGGVTETLSDSYRQMPRSLGCISQTTPEALGEMASSHAGSLSDRSDASPMPAP